MKNKNLQIDPEDVKLGIQIFWMLLFFTLFMWTILEYPPRFR